MILLFYLFILTNSEVTKLRPIRIAMAVDANSVSDIPVLIESIQSSALVEPKDLVFHIVFVSDNMITAEELMTETLKKVRSCFIGEAVNIVSKGFAFNRKSGWIQQVTRDNSKSKWVSSWATDMVRFQLGKIWPDVPRLLYLDNDIVVTCCLEEVWDHPLDKDTSLGLVTDEIPWSVTTQFARFYNGSHPLVIKNLRRNNQTWIKSSQIQKGIKNHIVTLAEFNNYMKYRYPNDGVLLIDIPKYNQLNVVNDLEEIADSNVPGLAPGRYGYRAPSSSKAQSWVVSLGSQQFTVLGFHGRWTELPQRANVRHFPDRARGFMLWYYFHGFVHYAGRLKARDACARVEARTMREMNPNRIQSYTPFALTAKKLYGKCNSAAKELIAARWCSKHVSDASNGLKLLTIAKSWASQLKNSGKGDLPVGNHHIRIGGPLSNYKSCNAPEGNGINECNEILTEGFSITNSARDDFILRFERVLLHQSPMSITVIDTERKMVQPEVAKSLVSLEASLQTKAAGRRHKPRQLVTLNKNLCGTNTESKVNMNECVELLPLLKEERKLDHFDVATLVVDVGIQSASILDKVDFTFIRPKVVLVRLGPYKSDELNSLEEDMHQVKLKLHRNALDTYVADPDDVDAGKLCCPSNWITQSEQCRCVWATRLNVIETNFKVNWPKGKGPKSKNKLKKRTSNKQRRE